MGDIAEMMLDGALCVGCGVAMPGNPPGHARKCRDCRRSEGQPHPLSKVPCKSCGRLMKFIGLKDHMRDAHNAGGKKA